MTSVPAVRIRSTRVTLLPVLFLAICLSPLAVYRPWLLWLFGLPLLLAAWVLRAGVDVDRAGLTVRALAGQRRVPWPAVAGLRIGRRGQVSLVLTAGGALRLPAVRARHLPLIAAASGGHLADPTAEPGAPDRAAPDRAAPDRAGADRAATEPAGPAGQ